MAGGKECWVRTQAIWAVVSTLPLTGCVSLAKSLPSLSSSLHIYKKNGLDQMFLKIPASSDVLGFF